MSVNRCRTEVLVLLVTAGLSLTAARATAQEATQPAGSHPTHLSARWTFENRSYFDPVIAEVHSADISITGLAQASPLQYSQTQGRRRAWTISLGKEVPLFGSDGTRQQGKESCAPDLGPVRKGCTGWGVWIAVDFHMLEDFRDPSNPIVDTDYRFGGMFKYRRALTDNVALGLRGYYGHESTHLGDEFSLAAQRNQAVTDFQRINVSYQYWEYGLSWEVTTGSGQVFVLRHLGSFLDPFTSWSNGYYSTDPLEVNGHQVTPSANRYEPTFEFEWRNESLGTIGSNGRQPSFWKPYLSLDLRDRTVYDYAKSSPTASEARQWSANVLLGYRRLRVESKRGEPDFFVRLYYGVNPYGQLRNQRGYFLIGLGLHVFV